MGYYVAAILNVLRGNPLDSKDELSFNHPPINNEADWQAMCNTIRDNWQALVAAIEQLPDEKLEEYLYTGKIRYLLPQSARADRAYPLPSWGR